MTETRTTKTLRRVGVWGLSTAGALGLWSSIGAADQTAKRQEKAADAAGTVVGWEAATTDARAPQIVRKVTIIRRHLPPADTAAPRASNRTSRDTTGAASTPAPAPRPAPNPSRSSKGS